MVYRNYNPGAAFHDAAGSSLWMAARFGKRRCWEMPQPWHRLGKRKEETVTVQLVYKPFPTQTIVISTISIVNI